MDFVSAIFSNTLVAFIILVAVVVFVHELGHFLVGKLFKIKVEEFSIGFGPKAFSFTRGGTEYRLNWLPLGGYVRFFGAELEEKAPPLELKERSINHAKVYKRALVSFAGPFANFLLSLAIMIGVSYWGTPKMPPILSVIPHSLADKAGFKDGDIVTKINENEIQDWQQLVEQVSGSPEKPLKIALKRNNNDIYFTVTPEAQEVETPMGDKKIVGKIGVSPFFQSPRPVVSQNSFLSVIGLQSGDIIKAIDGKEIGFFYQFIDALEAKTGAHRQSQLADMIVNDMLSKKKLTLKIMRPSSLLSSLEEKATEMEIEIIFHEKKYLLWAQKNLERLEKENRDFREDFFTTDLTIKGIKKDKKDKDARFSVWQDSGLVPGDTIVAIKGCPTITTPISLMMCLQEMQEKLSAPTQEVAFSIRVIDAQGMPKNLNFSIPVRETYDGLNRKRLGFDFPLEFLTAGAKVQPIIIKSDSLLGALQDGFHLVIFQLSTIFEGTKKLFTGQVPLSNLGGPIAIAGVAGEAAKAGLLTFLVMMSWISINIGLLNLLPLPALDGGHLVMHALEAGYGKPLPLFIQRGVQRLGVLLVILLFACVFYNDFFRLLHFR